MPDSFKGLFQVLVIEDEVKTAFSLASLVRSTGAIAFVAADGPGALRFADIVPPRVVLLDLGLPTMDGFEVARALRARPSMKDTLIVAVTGFNDDESRRLATEAGIDLYLVKPVDVDALTQLIRETRDKFQGQSRS